MGLKKSLMLLLVVAGLLALAGYRVLPMIKITNQCGQAIDILQIEVSGKTLDVGSLGMGQTARKSLRITRDSRFMVTYQLADGRSSRTPVGHISAPAWWSRTHITIQSGGALDIFID